MKGGREPIQGVGDLSLANPNIRSNQRRVRQEAWGEKPPQGKRKMRITEICDGNQVRKILQDELEKVTRKHGLNVYELQDLKKDLKNRG